MIDVDPGELREPIVYEEPTATRAPDGQRLKSWEAVFEGYAAVRPLSDKESFYAGGLAAGRQLRVTIRYRPGVRHGGRFRLVRSGRLLTVAGVLNQDERDTWLVVRAVESPDVVPA